MRKRMFLQLFEDGGGAGSGGQGGNAGAGNGSQGNAGGSGNQGSYSFAQAEEIANARADRAEKAALRSYFQQQGMTEQQVNQAIADYKEQQKKNQPNVTQLQQDLENSRNEVQHQYLLSTNTSYHNSSSSVILLLSNFSTLKLLSDTLSPSQFRRKSIY